MGWRRGEVWLDTEVLWFREGPGTPAFAGFAPAAIPAPASPPGLVASRRRRDEWRQRRNARRARMAVLAMAPAVIFPLTALRNGGGQGTSAAAEDPPSLTFRLGAGTVAAVDALASPPARPRADALPQIEWNRATSLGLPYAGSLVDGTRLPVEGPDWITWNPATESVPNAPWRLFGHERTIRAVLAVTAEYRAANPGAPRVVVGDISFRDGGPMTDEHVSHQNGLDVDVYYPRLDGAPRVPGAPDEVDRRLAQDLVDRFVAAGAQAIFVGYSTGLHGPAGVVTPYANHENHMHVRFPPPGG